MSKSEVTTKEMPNTFITDLMQHLNRRVIGQEEAKKALVGTLYQYLKHNVRQPLLMVGGTGCGKTYLINTAIKWIAETMPTVHFASRNVSRLTPAGWEGEDFEDVLCVFKTLEPGHSYIVHMDEIDKLMVPRHNSDGEDFNAAACGQVMNAISGEDQRMAGIDWSRILVVATGAFEKPFGLNLVMCQSIRKQKVLKTGGEAPYGITVFAQEHKEKISGTGLKKHST